MLEENWKFQVGAEQMATKPTVHGEASQHMKTVPVL